MRTFQNILVFLLAIASLGLWVYTGLHTQDMSPFLLHGTYYGMSTLFFLWSYSIVRVLELRQFSMTDFLRRYGWGLLLCLGMTLVIYISVKPSFKTLSDETNLLSTSHAMLYGKLNTNEMQAIRYFGNLNAITTSIDKRPALFPFLTTLLHTIRGFDAKNAFLVNAILMFVFLSAVFICARQTFSGPISAAAVFLVASVPIFSICGTSGGIDFIACFFLGLSLVILFQFLKKPSSELFGLLWMTLLMCANTRLESVVFLFIFMGFLFIWGLVRWAYLKENRLLIVMAPLWLLILFWGTLVNSVYLVDQPGEKHLFSLTHLHHNLLEFLKGQFDFRFYLPYDNLLHLLAVILIVGLFWGILIRKRIFQERAQKRFALVFVISLVVQLTIALAHFAGFYTFPTASRMFLPFAVTCALMPMFWLATYPQESFAKGSKLILLGSIVLFVLYHPIAVEGRFINWLNLNRETYFEHDVVQHLWPDKKILIVSEVPSQFTALEYGAIDFDTANMNIPKFMAGLIRHLYQDIIVVQRIMYDTNAPDKKNVLNPAYSLQTLTEYETADNCFIRISKVVIGPPPTFHQRSLR